MYESAGFQLFSLLLFYLKNRKGSTNERGPATAINSHISRRRIREDIYGNDSPEDSGDVDLTSHYTPLFPDCPDTKRRHLNPLHVLLPYPIPIGQSFALVLLSSFFFLFFSNAWSFRSGRACILYVFSPTEVLSLLRLWSAEFPAIRFISRIRSQAFVLV